jgi:hypothetical protein
MDSVFLIHVALRATVILGVARAVVIEILLLLECGGDRTSAAAAGQETGEWVTVLE